MPTGYTNQIQDGKINNGNEFLILCARAFGATIEMRDESLSTPIYEFKPDDYHLNAMKDSIKKLEKYKSMKIEEVQNEIDENYKEKIIETNKNIEKHNFLKEKYNKILNEIEEWNPPTNEHINLKKFAIEQIKKSIEFDCDTEYYEDILKSKKEKPQQWLLNKIEQAIKDIAYHQERYAEEVKRVNKRNKWVNDLRNSLKL